MPIPHYPSILLLEKRPDLFAVKEVIATEKLNGSTFRIHFPFGMESLDDIQFGSAEVELAECKRTGEKFPLNNALAWAERHKDVLAKAWEVIRSYGFSGTTIFGEAYGPGIQAKGVKYTDGKETLFRAFDIMIGENRNFVTTDLFIELMDKMGLDRVHEVYRGPPTMEAFNALLGTPSVEAKRNGLEGPESTAEGIVIRTNPLFRDVFGEWIIAKYKWGKFAEKTTAPGTLSQPKPPREATPADIFVVTYVTEGRLRNALGRLADRGIVLKNDMTDVPTLITEMVADLHKECEPEWKATGSPDASLKGAVSKVLGPLYRTLLGT